MTATTAVIAIVFGCLGGICAKFAIEKIRSERRLRVSVLFADREAAMRYAATDPEWPEIEKAALDAESGKLIEFHKPEHIACIYWLLKDTEYEVWPTNDSPN